jgi:hypothetical protein
MIIYGSTQYVDPAQNKEWYSLSVINQFDCVTKPICYKVWDYNNKTETISYCLEHHTSTSDSTSNYTVVSELTLDMKIQLLAMGYLLK